MKKINKITLILRGYSLEEAVLVAKEVSRFQCFNLEITTNTSGWEDIISELKRLEFANVPVGAGTVLDEGLLKRAINAGAEFALSPIMMTEQMLKIWNNTSKEYKLSVVIMVAGVTIASKQARKVARVTEFVVDTKASDKPGGRQ